VPETTPGPEPIHHPRPQNCFIYRSGLRVNKGDPPATTLEASLARARFLCVPLKLCGVQDCSLRRRDVLNYVLAFGRYEPRAEIDRRVGATCVMQDVVPDSDRDLAALWDAFPETRPGGPFGGIDVPPAPGPDDNPGGLNLPPQPPLPPQE
jgi:hypothetical protein